MSSHHTARGRIFRDLTRTRHMTAVSAVVLGTTFMPLLGLPEMYEVRAFQDVMDGLSAHAAQRDDEATRQRMAEVVVPAERESRGWFRETSAQPIEVRRLNVTPPDEDTLIAMIAPDAGAEPLPAVADAEIITLVAEEDAVAIDEEELEAIEEVEQPIVDEDEFEESEEKY